jgi:glutaredoxin 3
LEKNSIPYENLDVGENEEAREEMVKKSGQLGVPVIEVDGEILLDFNEKELKQKLGIQLN